MADAKSLLESVNRFVSHSVLEAALRATEEAGEILLGHFRKRIQVHSKGLANFVTEADLASEKWIQKRILESFPTHQFLAEESHQPQVGESTPLWIVDPLDGTSNFLHGIPHFAISIAYYERRTAQVGIVYNPVSKDLYIAVRGQGAWYNGERQKVDSSEELSEVMVACGFYYDRGKMMRATLDTIASFFEKHVHGVRRFGAAALDLCNTGCGQYGAFFEYNLHPWDYAAGQLFVLEAGGIATDCDAMDLPLDKPSSICAGSHALHRHALEVIRPHWEKYRERSST